MDDDLELVGTFLAAFYHQHDDIVGTTRALRYIREKDEYRRDLAYAFKRMIEGASGSALVELVRESANRSAETADEALAYLLQIFEDNLLRYDLEEGDEIRAPEKPE